MINIDDFKKIELTIGTIQSAERVPETDKLVRLEVNFGEETRQIVSGIAEYIESTEELVGKQFPFVTNLEPRTIKGLESNGMILAVGGGDAFAFLSPDRAVSPGTTLT